MKNWDGSEVNYREYREEIKSLASEILSDTKEMYEEQDGTDHEDWLVERIYESVDAHRWVIYYWGNAVIMEHTSNYDAVMDVDVPNAENGWLDVRLAFAWWAFHTDICNEIDSRKNMDWAEVTA